jgi:iron complex outermembrane recepter protein
MRYWVLASLCLWWAGAAAQGTTLAARDLADLSLEQLSNVMVSSVSRREEPLARAPASIYVITGDDIRRSGATSLPEALRLAPNLQVARVDSSQYAITARGFNSTTANKLLVLIDGRTVYTPLFSGTFWESQDVLLEDIERIEVISGPGATLWGANAVNGVINVISKSPEATQGTLGTAGFGNTHRQVAMRHGDVLRGGHYRVYAKAARRDETSLPGGAGNRDQADHAQVGFRADWGKAADGFTLQGDLYGGEIDQATAGPRDIDGLNLLGRWARDFGEGGLVRVQAYFDHTHREHPGLFKEGLDTYDLEVQHGLRAYGRHRLLWGVGLRRYEDKIENSPVLAFLPAQRTLSNAHVFVQDEIELRRGLDLTLGAKAERNSYTGTEFLPSARLAWQPTATQLVWSALSRAVRAPARLDRDLFAPGTPPFTALAGGPDFRSEIARVFELGYRAQASQNLSFSITGFHHEHENLRTLSPGSPGPMITNGVEGRTSGIEAWGSWRGADWWRIDAGAARLDQSLKLKPGASDLQTPLGGVADPESWGKLRAAFDLGASRELDFMLRYYGEIEGRSVPSYAALDARLAWHLGRNAELSLLLQNLLDARHVEWSLGAEFERAAYLQLRIGL